MTALAVAFHTSEFSRLTLARYVDVVSLVRQLALTPPTSWAVMLADVQWTMLTRIPHMEDFFIRHILPPLDQFARDLDAARVAAAAPVVAP